MERKKLIKLVTAAQNGDHKAVDTLFNAFYNDVYYFALKTVKDEETACEVTQDTFVSILKNFKDLKEPAAFVTWMKQIAYNHCARFFQKKKDVLVEEDEEGNTVFDTVAEERAEFVPDEALDQEDFRKTIMGMLDELSPEQRSATMLYYYSEMSVKQIAQIQGVSEGTVKSRLNYARKAVKKSVEDYEKKNDVKLHSVVLLPLLFWLFAQSKEAMPTEVVPFMVGEISSATGVALTAGGVNGTATGVAAASTGGVVAKLAGIPLAAKIIAGVTALSLVVGCIGVAAWKNNEKPVEMAEPTCQHEWVDANCTTAKSCSLCGVTEGVALGHKWMDANCEAPKICSVCSQTDGEALGHTWKDANCEAPKTCPVCGQTDGEALGHTWTEANYQTPKICSVCDTTDGEPLTPDFEKLGIDVITAEMGMAYDYIATCSVDTSKKTVGKVVFRDYHVFSGDEDYEMKDGYQWHSVFYTVTYSDDNAWDYGTSVQTGFASYYRTGSPYGHDESPKKTFTANYNGIDYEDCILQSNGPKFSGWKGRTCSYEGEIAWCVPDGYDGFVLMFYDYFAEWEEGQSFYEFMDENTVYFRFDESNAQNPGTDIPEQDDTTITEPSVPEPPVTEPPFTEPPVTEPPVIEPPVTEPPAAEPPAEVPEVTVHYVPDGCTYIMADGTKLQPGDAMPETCSDGDKFITVAYTYKYGFEYNGSAFGDTNIEGWGVAANDKELESYPELLSTVNGKPLVSMRCTFKDCEMMSSAPAIPHSVKNLSYSFANTSLRTSPVLPDGVTDISHAFALCLMTEAPVIPDSVIYMVGTFYWSQLKAAPEIPYGVVNMDRAFYLCQSLTTASDIPDSVTSIVGTFGQTALITAPSLGYGITNMVDAFEMCGTLKDAPVIPTSVINMAGAFLGCTALKEAPVIPEGVIDISRAFSGCEALKNAPEIPSSVTRMTGVFQGCTALTGQVVINAMLSDDYQCEDGQCWYCTEEGCDCMDCTDCLPYGGCFSGTVNPIVLTGSCEKLAELAATSENGNVTVA